MLQLRLAAQQSEIADLIDTFYRLTEVEAIALGVHGNFLEFYNQEFGAGPLNAILESGKIPGRWETACTAAKYPSNLSPISVIIYVSVDPQSFMQQHAVPEVQGQQTRYAVYVEYREPCVAAYDRSNHRPLLPGGVSVSGDGRNTAGTLGGNLKGSGNNYLMSCFHVLCNGSATTAVQRGRADGGSPTADGVGTICHTVPLTPASSFTFSSPFDSVDAATAEISALGVTLDPMLRVLRKRVGSTKRIADISLGDPVVFVGKESDQRDAKVFRYISRMKWKWNGALYNFGDVFEIEPRHFSYFGKLAIPGDSGSWVVGPLENLEELEAFGVVFGSSGKFAYCCFMENVLAELTNVAGFTFRYL